MSLVGTVDVSVEILGGLVTNETVPDLPHGVSPDCQDCQFTVGSVKTRPGVTALYTLAGNPTVNSMATYETLTEIPRFVSLDSLGVLRKDATPGGALVPIYSGLLPGSSFRSCTLFGRQYFAFGAPSGIGNPAGFSGFDIPRQYDDTNFDRVSQEGPGQAPSAVDENNALTIAAPAAGLNMYPALVIAAGPNGATEVGNIVTLLVTAVSSRLHIGDNINVVGVGVGGYNIAATILAIPDSTHLQYYNPTSGLAASGGGTVQLQLVQVVLTTAHNYGAVGTEPVGTMNVLVAGAGVAGYNGTWPVRSFDSATAFTMVINVFALAASGNGTVNVVGNIPAGKHQISVVFITRNGYYTKPAPPNSWVAAGTKRVTVTNIPIGPPTVIARALTFTGTAQASFYHLGPTGITIFSSSMYIANNTTTSTTVDFSDQVLLLGTLDDPLFNQIELPPVAGVIDYSNRLLAWGEQANLQSFLNLTFDGGSPAVGSSQALGWAMEAGFTWGGAAAPFLTYTPTEVVFGGAYAYTGNGIAARSAIISQSAAQNYLGNPILVPGVAYSVQLRAQCGPHAGANGDVTIEVFSATAGSLGIATVPYAQLTTAYSKFSVALLTAQTVIPIDTVLRIYINGVANVNDRFNIDNIEIFPTNAQFNNSNVRASKGQLNTQGQESYDSQTGLLQYNLNDGTSVRNMFKIRERLYIVKEHSFGVTQDDGISEPSLWSILDVSKKVGTPSVNGIGIGEDWVVIAHRTGLYLFWGGEPVKISQEIQPTWDTIDWQFGYTIAVTVDTRKRRIFICAPFGEANKPNKTLVLDYHDVGSTAEAIASNPPIHLTYAGRKSAFDKARKWCPWTIPANSVAQIELSNGETSIFFGSNDNTGNINQLDDTGTVLTDNGAVIPSYYTTAFFVERAQEQALQLGAHRKLFSYLTMFVQGSGTVGLTAYLGALTNAVALNPQLLSASAMQDIAMTINQSIERMAVKVSSSGTGQFFDLQKMTLSCKPEPWSVVRGM